ncbi:hypothetical protein GCM10008957_39960 [Deinococcus ruber]|uniref:Uncharacterized protein n=1 Tax=Deinococcus ruber TaxID=1848197 RepID=A0A918CIK1_9DEIO|nr:hypothetical protein GCM10008957_39960 [Deinococcus ruber]
MAVHGDDQIGTGRKMSVKGTHPDASSGRDITHRDFDPVTDEKRSSRVKKRLFVSLGVNPLWPRPGCL